MQTQKDHWGFKPIKSDEQLAIVIRSNAECETLMAQRLLAALEAKK